MAPLNPWLVFPLTALLSVVVSAGAVFAGDIARLALKGYDPVAYFTMGKPVPGVSAFEHTVDGVRYQFATAEHLAMFRDDPDRYAPRYRGLCAMGLGAKGYKVEANPENWIIHEGRLYVTQREFGPGVFKTDPERWVASANIHVQELEKLPVGSSLSWW